MMNLYKLSAILIRHQWKEAVRSSYRDKNLLINIFLGIFLIYFLINMILLGIFLGRIMLSLFPGSDPVTMLSGILFYYFLGDFLLRFLMQPIPILSVAPYQHLPIHRNAIFHFLLLKSGFSLFNFLPLVVLLPFTFQQVIPLYSTSAGLIWISTIFLLILANNYLVFFLKKFFSVKPLILLAVVAVIAALVWLDISQNRLLSRWFGSLIMFIVNNPAWAVLPISAFIFTYALSWYYLYLHRYLETRGQSSQNYNVSGRSRYISEKFGVTGNLVSLEMKLILRNNRPRIYFVLSILFMFYGFMIYPRHTAEAGYGMWILIGVLLTGIMTIQYGQLVLSWESSYFDRLCTSNITTRDIFMAKFWLFCLFNTAAFLVTTPYALYDYRILYVNFAAWLFNCGVNIFVILFLGTYNTKRVDMSKGAFFNYEGVTAAHFIMIFPVMGLPVLIYWLIALIATPEAGLMTTGLTGLAGLIFHRQLIGIVTRQFLGRKQKILYGFRNG
jgi:hypothetical protein